MLIPSIGDILVKKIEWDKIHVVGFDMVPRMNTGLGPLDLDKLY